jgi:hypothetical protein
VSLFETLLIGAGMGYETPALKDECFAFGLADECFAFALGRVAEWFKAAVLKTAVGASPP